jgi:ribosomal protein L37AE/L43A
MHPELKRRLQEVDPDLRIVRIPHRKVPPQESRENWEKAGGTLCPLCSQETVRIIRIGQWTGCLECNHKRLDKEDRDKTKREKFLKYMKAHNARIKR